MKSVALRPEETGNRVRDGEALLGHLAVFMSDVGRSCAFFRDRFLWVASNVNGRSNYETVSHPWFLFGFRIGKGIGEGDVDLSQEPVHEPRDWHSSNVHLLA